MRAFAGQYQQKPMPSTGNLIDPLWWKLYTSDELPVFDTVLMSVDCAFKGGQTSDFVSLQKWGCASNDCYLLEKDTRRLDFVQTEAAILAMLFETDKYRSIEQFLAQRAKDQLVNVKAKVFGVVLNDLRAADMEPRYGYYYYNYRYESEPEPSDHPPRRA